MTDECPHCGAELQEKWIQVETSWNPSGLVDVSASCPVCGQDIMTPPSEEDAYPTYNPENCPTCGAGPGFQIPVWEDRAAADAGADPDFIGCKECHTMREGDS